MHRCDEVDEEGKGTEEEGDDTNGGLGRRRLERQADQATLTKLCLYSRQRRSNQTVPGLLAEAKRASRPKESEQFGNSGMQCLLGSGGDGQHGAAWRCGWWAGPRWWACHTSKGGSRAAPLEWNFPQPIDIGALPGYLPTC